MPENNSLSPNRDDMLKHLQFLFSEPAEFKDGKIEIAYTPSHSGAVNQAEWFDLSELEKAADFAFKTNSQQGVNVYVGAALRNPDTFPGSRSDINDYYAATAVWVDLDDPGTAEAARAKYAGLPPSLVVVTGRHPHLRAQAWWHLGYPEENAATHKENLAHICAALNGDKAVVDSARVMRLAGSLAWPKKEGRTLELTQLIIPENPTYMVLSERFKSYFPGVQPPLTHSTSGGVGHVIANDGKPRNIITGKLNYAAMLEKTRTPGHWHYNMRDAVASMVGANWSDEQIRMACAAYCMGGATDNDLSVLIGTARNKWNVPDPQTQTQPEQYDTVTGEIKKRTLELLYADDIEPVTAASDFVEDVLRDKEFSVIYGESNCGKTFFMLDLAMHVALGRTWRGKQVDQGGVIYAALEGGHGTKNRIVAFRKRHGITEKIPLAVIPSSVNFLDKDGDMQALIDTIKGAQGRLGNVRLIVIDTLARAISGGDENSSMDMGQLIINADMLRAVTGAHISFIHHSGKDALKGARGHSSLRAAVDTEIEISRADTLSPSSIKIVKQREMEMIDEMGFSLERVELGMNDRNKEVTSCVVIPATVVETVREVRLTAMQKFMYDALIEALTSYGQTRNLEKDMPPVKCVHYDELRLVLEKRGFKEMLATEKKTTAEQVKSATQTARIGLKDKGKANFDGSYMWAV